MSRTLGIVSIKGGVGKTTVASSLATDLANTYGKKVLLVDANFSSPTLGVHMDVTDPKRTIHDVLAGKAHVLSAIYSRYGVDVMPGNGFYLYDINPLKLKDKLAKIKSHYDYIVLDSSPNLNDEMLATILASDALLVVSTPDEPTLQCSVRAAHLARQRGRPIAGIVVNKVRDPHYELEIETIEHATGIPVVAKLPDSKIHGRAVFTRIPAAVYKGNSRFAREIKSLNAALTGMNERPSFLHRLFATSFSREQVNRQLLKESFYSSLFI
ncbi:AAA family ATPase [Candidatus Pacearchaeota archaeon]|nr:AAA family ATPase [Candidatus Pacearchaeota archaeon]